MKNLILSLLMILLSIPAFSQWQGTWSSSFGNLQIIQKGNKVYGDYGTLGSLTGTYNTKTRTLAGTFHNKKAKKKGKFRFKLASNKKSFSGKWAWNSKLNSSWKGKKKSSKKPSLKSPEYKKYNAPKVVVNPKTKTNTPIFIPNTKLPINVKTNSKVIPYVKLIDPKKYRTVDLALKKIKVKKKANLKAFKRSRSYNNPFRSGNARDRATLTVQEGIPRGRMQESGLTDRGFDQENEGRSTSQNDDGLVCTSTPKSLSIESDIEHLMRIPNNDVTYPGAIFDLNSIFDGSYRTVRKARNPIEIFTDLRTGTLSTKEVENPNASSMQQSMTDLLRNHLGNGRGSDATPMYAAMKATQVYSEADMNLFISGSYSNAFVNISNEFSWGSNKKRYRFVLDYIAVYYNMAVTPPNEGADWFKGNVTLKNNWAYINNVKFGKRILFLVESDEDISSVENKLGFAVRGAGNARLNVNVSLKEIMKKSTIKAFAMGADISEINGVRGIDGINRVLSRNKGISLASPGVPLAYTFRSVASNEVIGLQSTANYTERQCIAKERYEIEVDVKHLLCISASDGVANRDLEIYGYVKTYCKSQNGANLREKYGKSSTVWNLHSDRYRQVDPGQKISINKKRYFIVEAEDIGTTSVYVKGRIKDEDNNGDDLLGDITNDVRVSDLIREGGIRKMVETGFNNDGEIMHLIVEMRARRL